MYVERTCIVDMIRAICHYGDGATYSRISHAHALHMGFVISASSYRIEPEIRNCISRQL